MQRHTGVRTTEAGWRRSIVRLIAGVDRKARQAIKVPTVEHPGLLSALRYESGITRIAVEPEPS